MLRGEKRRDGHRQKKPSFFPFSVFLRPFSIHQTGEGGEKKRAGKKGVGGFFDSNSPSPSLPTKLKSEKEKKANNNLCVGNGVRRRKLILPPFFFFPLPSSLSVFKADSRRRRLPRPDGGGEEVVWLSRLAGGGRAEGDSAGEMEAFCRPRFLSFEKWLAAVFREEFAKRLLA